MIFEPKHPYKLPEAFILEYQDKQPAWGPLGYITYKRTYARAVEGEDRTEEFWETIRRVVEGCFTVIQTHDIKNQRRWCGDMDLAAVDMYERMFSFKLLPPGRGLWGMGTNALWLRGSAMLNNCAFVSTKDMATDPVEPFTFMADMSMLGVGVAFDTAGAGSLSILPVIRRGTFAPEDSKEGWVDCINQVLTGYFVTGQIPEHFDYSLIRPAGSPIRTFGGIAPGPEPLRVCVESLIELLEAKKYTTITSGTIVDIMNLIGRCVVSGGVRRSAQAAFGQYDDREFVTLKDPSTAREELTGWRWASNNSVFCTPGMDYTVLAEQTARNGEPGYLWMDNHRDFGRGKDGCLYTDKNVIGVNPCLLPDAPVITRDGVKKLIDLNTRENSSECDEIWDGGKFVPVVKVWHTGKKPVFRYITRYGSFYSTEDHHIYSNGEKVKVGEAKCIDMLPTHDMAYPCVSVLDPQDVMDGLVIGDGSFAGTGSKIIVLCVGQDDQDYLNSEIKNNIKKPYYKNHTYVHYTIDTTIRMDELVNKPIITVPDRFYYASKKRICGFLRGLFSANGSVCGFRVDLRATSKQLIIQVQTMLRSLGISSYITTDKAKKIKFKNGTYECKESYKLNIGAVDCVKKFARMIGFIQKYKTEKMEEVIKRGESNTKKCAVIKEVEYIGDHDVYDITVDSPEHWFWCYGFKVSNCFEMSLESFELCNLVETFPSRHHSYGDYRDTLNCALLYAKAVTLIPTHYARTNEIIRRNRRIGISQSGITEQFAKVGKEEHLKWCDRGYEFLRRRDSYFSEMLGVNKSVKLTTVKPSGTVSLLVGTTPGIHYPYSKYYYRTIRLDRTSELVDVVRKAGYRVEDSVYGDGTLVAYFPVSNHDHDRFAGDVSLMEQVQNMVDMQQFWSDNSVSCTVTFQPEEALDIAYALTQYDHKLKCISFLPFQEHRYEQAPYIPITEDEYNRAVSALRPMTFVRNTHEMEDKFCDSEYCMI